MAAFEVFVPVRGEVIYTVEADNAADAQDIVSTIDWSDGELNVDIDSDDEIRVERISDERCTFCGAVLVREDCPNYGFGAEHARPRPATFNAETGQPYVMRHFRV